MNKLVNYIIKNGGMTYNPRLGEHVTSGFMCAKAENEMIIDGLCGEMDLAKYMAKYAHDFRDERAMFGAWMNQEDGKTYLDTSFVFETEEEAIAFGKANNQLAIFHLDTFTEIRISYEDELLSA